MPCAVPPLFPTCVHGYTQSVHMSSAKIRGKTSAEAGVQRISPSTICQKSFLSVTAEKLRVNSLLIEKNIGFVKSQTPEWSAGPNLYLRRTQYLHALFVYIFLAFLRGSWFKGQNNTLILDGSQASKCPTQLTVDRGSVDLIVWEWWWRSLNLVCLCAPWSNNGPHCLTVSRWEILSRRRGPSTLPRHPVIRTQTRGRITIRSGGWGRGVETSGY